MKLSLLRFYCHNIVMSSNPDTMKTRRPSPTPEGEALYEMMVLIPPLYRRMRAINGRRGQLSIWSDDIWGLLSSLQLGGPRTVPQIALARGVARQRVRKKIVGKAHAADLVLFRDNPNHKRSWIVDLTRGGSNAFERIDKELRDAAQKTGDDYDIRDLDAALRVLFGLRENLQLRAR